MAKKKFHKKTLNLRPIRSCDAKFLEDLYLVSRDWEIAMSNLPMAQIKSFLRQQYASQKDHYDKAYPNALRQIIEYRGKPIGRLFTDQVDGTLRLIDITITRKHRGLGIGSYLLNQLLQQAKTEKRHLTLHVHRMNPARFLYESLGLSCSRNNGDHLLMRSALTTNVNATLSSHS